MHTRSHGIFYGWVIALSCLLLHFAAGGMTGLGFSLHAPYLREGLGLTNAQLALIPTFRCLATMAALPLAERLSRHCSLRRMLSISCLVLAAVFWGFALCKTALSFCLLALVMGAVYAFGTTVPITLLLHRWFHSRRGTAASLALSGAGVCSIAAPPAVALLIDRFGLQGAFFREAACIALLAVLLFLLLRDTPQEMGLEPLEGPAPETVPRQGRTSGKAAPSAIWLLLAASALAGCVGSPSSTNLSIHFVTEGIPYTLSAAAVSLYGLSLTAGKLSYGLLTDRLGAPRVNAFFFICWAAAQGMTIFVTGQWQALLFTTALLHGIGNSLATVGLPVWAENFSTEETYGRNMERCQLAYSVGSLAATPLPGILADITGSYAVSYIFYFLAVAAAFILLRRAYRLNEKRDISLSGISTTEL